MKWDSALSLLSALNAVYVEQFDFVKRPAQKKQQWNGLKRSTTIIIFFSPFFWGWGGYLNKQILGLKWPEPQEGGDNEK